MLPSTDPARVGFNATKCSGHDLKQEHSMKTQWSCLGQLTRWKRAERMWLPNDLDLLGVVIAVCDEDKPGGHQSPSSSDPWLQLVAELRNSCSFLPQSAFVSD
jgi:hypothetical protein